MYRVHRIEHEDSGSWIAGQPLSHTPDLEVAHDVAKAEARHYDLGTVLYDEATGTYDWGDMVTRSARRNP